LRLNPYTRPSAIAVAESTQRGIVTFGHEAADGAQAARRWRRSGGNGHVMPMMGLARPPNDL